MVSNVQRVSLRAALSVNVVLSLKLMTSSSARPVMYTMPAFIHSHLESAAKLVDRRSDMLTVVTDICCNGIN
jgi:hypothetical protein